MDAGWFAGIFAKLPTEWMLHSVSNPGAGNQRFYNYVYMYVDMHYYVEMHYYASFTSSYVIFMRP